MTTRANPQAGERTPQTVRVIPVRLLSKSPENYIGKVQKISTVVIRPGADRFNAFLSQVAPVGTGDFPGPRLDSRFSLSYRDVEERFLATDGPPVISI
jgi:hypothetical protein